MRRAIRPGITSGGTTKLIQDTTTNRPKNNFRLLIKHVGKKALQQNCIKTIKFFILKFFYKVTLDLKKTLDF
jgi:hypothetical protein